MSGVTLASMAETDSSRAQQVHLREVVAQDHVGLAVQGEFQRGRGDVGVAIAVAADPLAHAQEGFDALAQTRLPGRGTGAESGSERSTGSSSARFRFRRPR